MSSTITLWDKEGNPHRMTAANARDMVNHMGWTLVPPMVLDAAKATDEALKAAEDAAAAAEAAKALEEAQKAAEARAVEVAAAAARAAEEAAAEAAKAAEKAADAETSATPEKMEVEDLKKLATSLGVEVDSRWGKTRLLNEIKKASAEG